MRHLIIPLLLLGSSLVAQESPVVPAQPATNAPGTAQHKCMVEGKVVDSSDGKPLKKTILTLIPNEKRDRKPISVSTDADGIFAFKAVDPGRFRLIAARRGYVDQQYGETGPRRPGTIISLEPGQHIKDILFRLQPGAAV